MEVEALKSTLKKIYEKLSEAAGDGKSSTIGFNTFLNLLSPNDEDSYDLLPWSLETFTLAIGATPSDDRSKRVLSREYLPLTDFIKSLSNHFRATPALVRYGACISLHASLTVCPSLVQSNKSILTFIISGVLDTDYLSSFLYLTMLETFCASFSKANIKEMVSKLRHELTGRLDYDVLYGTFDTFKTTEVRLADILDKAVEVAPPLAPKLLHKLINSLEFLAKTAKLRQMELVRLWSRKIEKFDTYTMQTLVPMLNDDDDEIRLKTGMLAEILGLVTMFPIDRLSDDLREELLNTHIRLAFHKDPGIRSQVYEHIGSSISFWKASSLFNAALGILFLGLGDQSTQCATLAADNLCKMLSGSKFESLVIPLGIFRDTLTGPLPGVIKGYDDLANFIEKNRSDLEELVDAITHEANVDEFWSFFLEDAPDNQLVRPDDYSYVRNFIHMPFWISILLTKLSVPPPPAAGSEATRRNVMPITPANKRRFITGFLICLLPTCGMPDPSFRRAACLSAVYCCFRQGAVQAGIMRGLLDYVSQQMIGHKQWTYQLSSLDILSFLVRIKLPGVSPAILLQYLDLALDVAFNSPSSIVKVGALELIEVFLLVFPSGVGTKLQDIRDVVRALIVDAEPDVVTCACRVYPLVFRCVSNNNTKEFHDYLRNEIQVIQRGGLEAASDPLISGLSREEIERVLCLSIRSLGSISSSSSAYMIVQELLRLIKSDSSSVRLSALCSIFAQMHFLDHVESSTILWIILPLYADASNVVRMVFSKFLRKVPTVIESVTKVLPAHPDDSFIMNSTTLEELLLDGALIYAGSKNLGDIIYDLYESIPQTDLSELVRANCIIPSMNISEVLYHLQEMQKNTMLQANAILVISELACASILEYSPPAFKQIVTKITHQLLVEAIREFCPSKAPELCKKYIPVILSVRQPARKRLYAIYLTVELGMISGEDEMTQLKEKVYGSLSRIMSVIGIKHALFRNLLGNAKKSLKNKDPVIRLRSLSIFRIFARHLPAEEAMNFCFLFLADSNREVRKKARDVIALEGVLDFAIPGLKAIRPNMGSRRALILESCKLPSIQRLGVTINTNTIEEAKIAIPLQNEDAFNIKYYSSDRRRKFTERYGLAESKFARTILPLTQSVMEYVEEKSGVLKKYSPELLAKYQWLLNLDAISILHECMKRFPQVAVDAIQSLLEEIETVVKGITDLALDDTFEEVGDIEAEIHLIDTTSNLLFAFDGLDEKVPSYVDRLQAMILSCNTKAEAVRESLYLDLESSFYFFNEYIDVPIVSEEQYVALEKYKASTQEATLEMVKSGKLDKLSSLDAQKVEINDVIDLKSEQLRKLTIIALHCTSGYGLFHALTLASTDNRLVSSIQFLADMLDNEHRGIRMASVEAITTITRIQIENAAKPALMAKVDEQVHQFLDRLKGESSNSLYRRRADIINLMAQLVVFVSDRGCRIDVLEQLIRFWKDPDSEVRTIAIKMLQHLGESGLPEVIEGFRIDLDDLMGQRPPDIMREVAAFLSNPDYCEKDHLNSLLSWRFAEGRI
ncbi:armadillo-type protein [Chytridium lagenaria]|nr:armadillo-type protein [Chytridium lagenaria]